MEKLNVRRAAPWMMSLVLLVAGCAGGSDGSEAPDAASSGGSTGQGSGGSSTGGSSTGGSSTGGSSTGGSSTGGSSVTTGSGGAAGVAGATGGVGGQGRGGATGSGGATSSGGVAGGVGGSKGTGGAAGAAGAKGSGGTTGTGGSNGTGGATGSGGTTGAGGAADPCGASNPATVPLPVIPAGTFDVTTYGAAGDDQTDDTKAIQAALTAAGAAGGGTVNVPAGTFLSGPVVMSSGTRLQLASGATLKMLPMGTYPNTTAFITAGSNQHDLAITGAGTIDGQGQAWWNALTATPTLARPQEISIGHATRLQISGIRLTNPPEEHVWVKSDTDVTVTGITISTLAVSGQHIPNNTDGVDISGTGVFFCGNNVACGDDNVVMEGSNIYVAYSTFGVGHGCTIGSGTTGGVSNVTVDHLTMNGTTAGIRMKSDRGNGGLVKGLTYSNITMTNVTNPVYITSYYPSLPTDPTADTAQPITAGTPYWEDITIKNLTATGSSNAGILWGLPEAKISDVTFDNVKISASTGMVIYHATGISFTDGSTVTAKTGAAVTTYDATVTGITTTPY